MRVARGAGSIYDPTAVCVDHLVETTLWRCDPLEQQPVANPSLAQDAPLREHDLADVLGRTCDGEWIEECEERAPGSFSCGNLIPRDPSKLRVLGAGSLPAKENITRRAHRAANLDVLRSHNRPELSATRALVVVLPECGLLLGISRFAEGDAKVVGLEGFEVCGDGAQKRSAERRVQKEPLPPFLGVGVPPTSLSPAAGCLRLLCVVMGSHSSWGVGRESLSLSGRVPPSPPFAT